MKKVLLSHPGCGPFVQHAARALYEAGLLSAYVTTFNYRPESRLGQTLKTGMRLLWTDPERELSRRRITEVPEQLVVSYPLPELIRTFTAKIPMGSAGPIFSDLVWEKAELWFDRIVSRRHVNGADAVYGYEHAALETFRAQKARNGFCIYEMPTCHHKTKSQLLDPEFDRIPEVQTPYERHRRRLSHQRNDRKDQELFLADLVIANSTASKDSLIRAGISDRRILVVPLGAPPVNSVPRKADDKEPFIFLSAGSQSVGKGVHYLLEAWRRVAPRTNAELWLIGTMLLPRRMLHNLPGTVVVRPSVPREELFEMYRRASVLVFPSLCDGFGMVITEAMSHGLPVITTPNTAGPDFIQNGRNGFIVPIRDPDHLAATMEWCLDHRGDLLEIGNEAANTAAKWQWSDYRSALGNALSNVATTGWERS
jgi:glycosyltransferase involved in cell wall biosynthesis